jgi:hypothetical protein
MSEDDELVFVSFFIRMGDSTMPASHVPATEGDFRDHRRPPNSL